MSDNNFQPIFDYLDETLGKIQSDVKEIKSNQQLLQTSITNLSSQVKKYH